MRIVKSKRLFTLVIVSGCLILALHLLGGILLQQILREVFSKGTNCQVSLENSRLYLFPISATTENVTIIHSNEPPEAGFRARKISVELGFWALFRKQVVLDNLRIDGASVHSFGADTGFINTLAFLFSKPDAEEEKGKGANSWHEVFTGGWRVWVPLVAITAKPEESGTFVIGEPEAFISGDRVYFESKDPTGEPEDPAVVQLRAENVTLKGAEFDSRALGELQADATIGGGVVRFTKAVLSSSREQGSSQTQARGVLYTKDEGRYKINWEAKLQDSYLSQLVLPRAQASTDKATLTAQGTLGGDLLHPLVEANFSLEAEELPTYLSHAECIPKKISGSVSGSMERISIENLSVDTFLQEGEARFDLDNAAFQTNLNIVTDSEMDFIRTCFRAKLGGIASREKREAMIEALSTAVVESLVKITVDGKLEPLEVKSTFEGELNRSDPRFRSRLDASLDWSTSTLALSLKERGVLPQILPEPPRVESSTGLEVTRFQTATNSHIDVKVTHDFDSSETNIERLDFTRYPLVKLLLRATPFLDQQLFEIISSEIDTQSTIDGKATAQIQPSLNNASGSGSYVLRSIGSSTIALEELRLPFRLSTQGLEIRKAVGTTPAGKIDLNFTLGAKGKMLGGLGIEQFDLRQLPAVQTYLPSLALVADGRIALHGSVQRPTYSAEFVLSSAEEELGSSRNEGKVKLEGDSEAFRATGSLFDGAGVLALNYPLVDGKRLTIDARAEKLPLDFLLPSPSSEAAVRSSGEISAALQYQGERENPLLGSGELRVQEVRVTHQDLLLSNPRPLLLTIKNQRLDFGESILSFNNERLTITGYLDAESGWKTDVNGVIAIGEYLADFPRIEQLSGNLKVDLAVRGQPEKPTFFGSADLMGGSVSVPLQHTVVGADDVLASLAFDKTTLEIQSVSARVGGGSLTGSGTLRNFLSADTLDADITLELDDVAITPVENSVVQFAGPVHLTKRPEELALIESELQISSALYESQISLREVLSALTSWLLPGKRSAVVASSLNSNPATAQTDPVAKLDITIRGDNGIVLDTSFAQAELSADFRVSGDSSMPKLTGELEVLEGHFGFQSTQFDIVAGSVTFSDRRSESDPELELVGESRVQTITGEEQLIRVIVSGRLSQPILHFSSDSGLSERDIVALLGAGSETGAGFSILKSKREPRTFRELISPASDLSLSDRLVGLTGFSDVQIQTELSQSTGEFVPSVVASRPITEQVDLKIQSELSGERTSEVGVRYPLTPYLEFATGWSNASVTSDVNNTSGSYEVGVRYKKTFSGFLFWKPKELKEE